MEQPRDLQRIRGVDAEALLSDDGFTGRWAALCAGCPWGTTYQSPAFLKTWYRTYRAKFEPLLILMDEPDGAPGGLLPLAIDREDRALIVAGGYQAEYQTWICLPEHAASFPPQAIDSLRVDHPSAAIRFRYLPPQTPLSWITEPYMRRLCHRRIHRRPLLRFGDGSEITASLKKPGNKSRLRQMRKLGPVDFKQIVDPLLFPALLDEIIRHHDARHLATRGCAPFVHDPLKRDFHLALMNTPSLFHITTLTVGGTLASAHMNVFRGSEVQLNLITHNPRFDHFSPGKLHVLMLSQMLFRQGLTQLDLTPGGDPYKERFANAADDAHELCIYPSAMRRLIGATRDEARIYTKRLLMRLHLTPMDLRRRAMSVTGKRAPVTERDAA